MAFTRKMLKALGIEEDKIDQIMDAHTEVTDALIAERDTAKATADKLPKVQEELEKVKNDLKAAGKDADGKDYKSKYEAEKAEHEKLKDEIKAKAAAEKTDKALLEWAKAQGYSEAGAKKIVKYGGYRDRVQFDNDGKPTNLDDLKDDVAAEWGEYKGEPKTDTHKSGEPMTGGDEPKKSLAAQYYADYMNRVYGTKNSDTSSNDSNKEG